MRLRPVWLVPVVLLLPAPARASDHTASIFGAVSFLSGSSLQGGHGALEVSWPTRSRIHDHLAVLVDFSVHGGSDSGADTTRAALLFGGRGLYKFKNRNVASAHFLAGVQRAQRGAGSDNDPAIAFGVAYDVLLGNTAVSGFSFRSQLDWVRAGGDTSARGSFGLAYRFKKSPIP